MSSIPYATHVAFFAVRGRASVEVSFPSRTKAIPQSAGDPQGAPKRSPCNHHLYMKPPPKHAHALQKTRQPVTLLKQSFNLSFIEIFNPNKQLLTRKRYVYRAWSLIRRLSSPSSADFNANKYSSLISLSPATFDSGQLVKGCPCFASHMFPSNRLHRPLPLM